MTNLKKQVLAHKIYTILQEHSIVLFYHSAHTNSVDWRLMKHNLQTTLGSKKISSLFVKNRIAQHCLATFLTNQNSDIRREDKKESLNCTKNQINISVKQLSSVSGEVYKKTSNLSLIDKNSEMLFQGPTLIVGLDSTTELISVNQTMKKFGKYSLVAGLLQNKLLNNLDLLKLLELDNTVYQELVTLLEYSIRSIVSLKQIADLSFLKPHILFNILDNKK